MKVKAKSMGYYNNMRQRPGAVFELEDPKMFSERWMEKVVEEEAKKVEEKPKSKKKSASSDDDVI